MLLGEPLDARKRLSGPWAQRRPLSGWGKRGGLVAVL